MKSLCISPGLSNSDMITLFIGLLSVAVAAISVYILYKTLVAIKISNETTATLNQVQSAETTIIKQIEFHYNLLKGISINIAEAGRGYGIPNGPEVVYGQDAFEIMYDILKEKYKYVVTLGNENNVEEIENTKIIAAFSALYKVCGSKFGNYYKNLYFLIKYIDELPQKKEYKKTYYIDLIKAQLSKYEILLLAYDCIWIQDKTKGENFIEYASKHGLLSALETEMLMDPRHRTLLEKRYKINFRSHNELN
jgi:hypothetical protein